ncbi:MAG TPA: MFS transporter [Bacteroidales bacterium]|nr:MFS transporter [Bacteroidales bacterium]
MKQKPRLSFWQIWNMSFGFLGIQFGFALQNANVSRIFETLGANVDDIPILWIAAPVTGLIMQPIIGHMSDNTWNRLGRRRPYFLIGAILASLALLIMPNSPTLWVAAGMLWIMDASINISMEPFRAFVGDMLPSRQRTMGFAMQSFFIGIGAIVASALPYVMTNWIGFANTAPDGEIPPSVRYSFYIGGLVFFLAVIWTILRTKEYSPEQLSEFQASERQEKGTENSSNYDESPLHHGRFLKGSILWILSGAIITFLIYWFNLEKELYILGGGLITFGLVQVIVGLMTKAKNTDNGLVEVINDLFKMPLTMKQLAFVQFFSWFALFSMWIYTTSGVTSSKYDMKLYPEHVNELVLATSNFDTAHQKADYRDLKSIQDDLKKYSSKINQGDPYVVSSVKVVKFFNDKTRLIEMDLSSGVNQRIDHVLKEYNTGADWVGVLMAVYNGFAAIMAFVLIILARLTNRKTVHFISLVIGGISLISFYFINNPNMLMISELGIGLAWASILAMPYAILTGSLPAHKMGTYMGIFNFFIVIPQILAATILGFFVKHIADEQPIYALVLGGASMILAGFLTLIVKDVDEPVKS